MIISKTDFLNNILKEKTNQFLEWLILDDETSKKAKQLWDLLSEIDFNSQVGKLFLEYLFTGLNITIKQKTEYKVSKDILTSYEAVSTYLRNVNVNFVIYNDQFYFYVIFSENFTLNDPLFEFVREIVECQ